MKRILVGLAVLALSAALLWLLTTYDLSMLRRLPTTVIAVLVVLSLVYSLIYGVGVAWLLRGLGQPRPVWRVFLVISGGGTASYLGNLQLGIPLRLLLFNKILDVPYAQGAAAVALETACWFGLMGVGLLLAGTASNLVPWIAMLTMLVLSVIAYRTAPAALRLLNAWLPDRVRGVSLKRLRDFVGHLAVAVATLRWTWLLATLAVFSTNYLIDALSVSLIVHSLGQQIALLSALEAVILSYLAGLISFIPLGLGVRDVSLVVLLENGGVSRDVATSVAIVHRVLRTVLPLLIGLVAINLLGARQILSASPKDQPSQGR